MIDKRFCQMGSIRQNAEDITIIPCLGIGIIGCVQPEILFNILVNERADGMFPRFCIASPEPIPFTEAGDKVDDQFFMEAILKIIKNIRPHNPIENAITEIPLDDAAEVLLSNYRKSLKEKEANATGLMVGCLGKNGGKSLRLALVFEVIEAAFNPKTREELGDQIEEIYIHKISGESMQKAITLLSEYFDPMAEYSLGFLVKPSAIANAAKIALHILKTKPEIINTREIGRAKILGKYAYPKDYNKAFEQLEVHGILTPIEQPRNSTGGRKRKDFTVNPLFFTCITPEEVI